MHLVGFGEVERGDLVGGLELAEGEGEAFADAVVGDGEDVGAAEAEDEEHLDGPAADAADLGEVLDDVLVGHAADAGESGDGTVDGLGGEVAEGEGLVVREAGGAELLVGCVEEVLCGEVLGLTGGSAFGGDGIEAFEEAAVDGGGGFAVKLLINDAFDESFEGRLGAGDAQGEGAGALDEPGEPGVGGGELGDGEGGVVAWRSWDVGRTRHQLTVSQREGESLHTVKL